MMHFYGIVQAKVERIATGISTSIEQEEFLGGPFLEVPLKYSCLNTIF